MGRSPLGSSSLRLRIWLVRKIGLATACRRALAELDREMQSSRTTHSGAVFLPGAEVSGGPRERIQLGFRTHIAGQLLVFPSGGRISMGDYCSLGPNSRIWSQAAVSIGHHVLISHNVSILDTDGHELDSQRRALSTEHILTAGLPSRVGDVKAAPVTIGDHAWIACGAIVLKGVTIGEGAIVAAGSVVGTDVPPFSVAAGNPAVVVRTLEAR